MSSPVNALREIPVSQVLESVGLVPHREGKSVMWKDGSHSINVTGQKWFDHEAGKGSYGAIDLVIHLCGVDLAGAVSWLRRTCHSLPQREPTHATELRSSVTSPAVETSNSQFTLAFAEPDQVQWDVARRYLTMVRQVSADLIDVLHASGDIMAKPGGIIFLHRTFEGEIAGSSIRASWHCSKFRQTLGSKQRAWFTTEGQRFPWDEPDRPVVVVESGIEALSYATMHQDGSVCISVSGNHVPDALIQKLGRQPREIILALNNDTPGQRGTLLAIEKLEALGTELKAHVTTQVPRLKDWNDELCAARKRGISIR